MTPSDLQARRLNNNDVEDQASGIFISVLFPAGEKVTTYHVAKHTSYGLLEDSKEGLSGNSKILATSVFQLIVFSPFRHLLLCNFHFVFGSGNGYNHDYITRCNNKTERK